MKKTYIVLFVVFVFLIGFVGCKLKEKNTDNNEKPKENTESSKVKKQIDYSFFGTWVDETTKFKVTIRESELPKKVDLIFSDKNMLSGDKLKVDILQDNTINVLGVDKDTLYSFTLNTDDTLVFASSSKRANQERIPSVSAPILLKRD